MPRVDWFFGRGLSIGCGLTWTVPTDWYHFPRAEQIARITAAVTAEMSSPSLDTHVIHDFLNFLAARTIAPWRHQFYTTNWDFLLQREMQNLGLHDLPSWLASNHVYHLNGTVEQLPDNQHRSKFVLETDTADARVATLEGNKAFDQLVWNQRFVVVGMSFEAEVDRFLLRAIKRIEGKLPIGESVWIVVNPDSSAVAKLSGQLKEAIPHAKVEPVVSTFGNWFQAGLPELVASGATAHAAQPE